LKRLILLLSLLSNLGYSMTIEKVKDGKALIDLEQNQLSPGTEVFALNADDKKAGLLRIKLVKGRKAIAEVIKGVARPGMLIIERSDPLGRFGSEPSLSDIRQRKKPKIQNGFGFTFTYSMDTMSFLATDNVTPATVQETVSLRGNSMKLKGFYDYVWRDPWNLRFAVGIDGFNGKYTATNTTINSNGSSISSMSLTYLTFDGLIKWDFYNQGGTKMWAGGGYSFQYSVAGVSNIFSLQLANSYNNVFMLAAGADIPSGQGYIPFFFHYNYYLSGSGVTASSLNFGTGWAWY
jgi:hypothetical protein